MSGKLTDREKKEITQIEDKNVIYEFYNSNQVKKLLKFNY